MATQVEPKISILVCAYNMARELPRTLLTLSKSYQRNCEGLDWRVVILDNGSETPLNEGLLQSILPGVKVLRPANPRPSPAAAINEAMRDLDGELLGLWIDGARLGSPGIIHNAVEAWRTNAERAIGTVAFHLGHDVQMRTVPQGYDAKAEDALLASVPWETNGYRLFDISVLAGSSVAGWFGCISETNGLFIDRKLWDTLGGLDERFHAPGGGYVNLDLWERAVAASDRRPWILLGEGTFHQVHGGVATNGPAERRAEMLEEYVAIHDREFVTPEYEPHFVGTLDARRFVKGYVRSA